MPVKGAGPDSPGGRVLVVYLTGSWLVIAEQDVVALHVQGLGMACWCLERTPGALG